MPADDEEIHDTKAEGIPIYTQIIPLRVEDGPNGKLKLVYGKAKMVQVEGQKRPKPVLIEGEEYEYVVDTIIAAIGQRPDTTFLPDDIIEKMEFDGKKIKVNERQMTSIEGIFAGGDITNWTADAISAIADGLRAVKGIELYLKDKK